MGMPRLVLLALCLLSCLPDASLAQEPRSAVAEARAEFGKAEKRIDGLYQRCPTCNGSGKWTPPALGIGPKRQAEKCSNCDGRKRLWPADEVFLAEYLAYCDILQKHAGTLLKAPAPARQYEATRANYARFIQAHSGAYYYRPPIQSGLSARINFGPGSYKPLAFDALALEILVAKSDPSGRPIAFGGCVVNVTEREGRTLAEVSIGAALTRGRNGELTVDGAASDRTCKVYVPNGVRWAPGAGVYIIGRVTAVSGESIVVETYPGTE